MILKLDSVSIDQFRKLRPTKKEESSCKEVQSTDLLHYFSREEYGEMLGKMCFLCAKTLILETAAFNDIMWGGLPRIGSKITPTTGRIEMQLNHFGFSLKKKQMLKHRIVRFVAEKMPRVDWDGEKELYNYKVGVVVNVPLTHPTWYSLFTKKRSKERQAREQEMLGNFRVWYFAPLEYCRLCKRVHQGSHRVIVARELRMKSVPVRIRPDEKCPYLRSHKKRKK